MGFYTLVSTVFGPTMTLVEMVKFCTVGFTLVMLMLTALYTFAALIGKIFIAFSKK